MTEKLYGRPLSVILPSNDRLSYELELPATPGATYSEPILLMIVCGWLPLGNSSPMYGKDMKDRAVTAFKEACPGIPSEQVVSFSSRRARCVLGLIIRYHRI
jgi:hypothetical protein